MKFRAFCLSLFLIFPTWATDFIHGYAVSLGGSSELAESAHADEAFTLMSVAKFPLAIVVLHEVDRGKLALNTRYHLSAEQLPTDTWSPLADAHPQGGDFTLLQLVQAAVSQSDNNACAFLFRLVGGAPVVQQFLNERMGAGHALTIARGEDYFRDFSYAQENHATPRAMVQLLHACFVEQRLLSAASTQLLRNIMSSPSAGTPRLGAGLPAGATLAHKSGTGPVLRGVASAHNDIGVLRLQDGRIACIASFIRDSRAEPSVMEATHAELTRRAAALLQQQSATDE